MLDLDAPAVATEVLQANANRRLQLRLGDLGPLHERDRRSIDVVVEQSGVLARVADDPRLHHVHGAALCALAAAVEPIGRDELLPDYVREPDAKPRA
jgi:hypothetical protein